MSFDITLHPISPAEFRQFFADTIDKTKYTERFQNLATTSGKKRYEDAVRFLAFELTPNRKINASLIRLYYQFPQWQKDIRQSRASFAETFGYAAATIAGFLHPYWYMHSTGISGLSQKEPSFSSFLESITTLAPELFKGLKDTSGGIITAPNQGGGYIDHSKLEALQQALTGQYSTLAKEVLGESGLETVVCAIRYAQQTGTGLLEASSIMVPSRNECVTNYDNLRAAYLNNLDDFRNMRERTCHTLEEALQHRETVTALYLGWHAGNDQPEPLPEEIGELTRLRELVIHPGFQVSSLPASIGRLQKLKRISINESYSTSSNHLSFLPPEIGKLTNLRNLSLKNNRLKQLPPEIGQLSNLTTLYLSGNALTTLPETIGDLPNIMYIDISKNELEELPESIGNLAKLFDLKLNDNQLRTLPESMGMLSKLYKLELNNNQLATLPESLGNLPEVRIQLKKNGFSRTEKMRLNKLFPKKLQFS